MLYEHIILTCLRDRFDTQDSWFILQILRPICSKVNSETMVNEYIKTNFKNFIQIFTFKKKTFKK